MALKSVVPLTPTITLISDTKVLDKSTGNIYSISDQNIQAQIKDYYNKNFRVINALDINAEEVVGLESQKIDFYYKTSDGKLDIQNGFLIEVYASGTNVNAPDNGSERLYAEAIEDPLDNSKQFSDSFSNYFTLEMDVD